MPSPLPAHDAVGAAVLNRPAGRAARRSADLGRLLVPHEVVRRQRADEPDRHPGSPLAGDLLQYLVELLLTRGLDEEGDVRAVVLLHRLAWCGRHGDRL